MDKPNETIPYVLVDDIAKTLEYWETTFGAEVTGKVSAPDGTVMHAEVSFGDARVMFGPTEQPMPDPDFEEWVAPPRYHAIGVYIAVPDVETVHGTAQANGATITQPLETQFWGDRTFNVVDHNGLAITFGETVEELTPEEMQERAREFYG